MYAAQQNQMSSLNAGIGGPISNQASQLPRSDTIRGLLDIAYEQIAGLEQEIAKLGEQLMPVRELSPTKESIGNSSALGEPEVIGLIRGLIGRLSHQQSIVRAIANETRI